MLEDKVVELNIVARTSDNTIGRPVKNVTPNHPLANLRVESPKQQLTENR